jgi:hypothetical protein
MYSYDAARIAAEKIRPKALNDVKLGCFGIQASRWALSSTEADHDVFRLPGASLDPVIESLAS